VHTRPGTREASGTSYGELSEVPGQETAASSAECQSETSGIPTSVRWYSARQLFQEPVRTRFPPVSCLS
jgi:hypothetical protein